MSQKESRDYVNKLMNDIQNKINDVDNNSNKLKPKPIKDNFQKKKVNKRRSKNR